MRVMLTSCGLETEQLKEQFLKILGEKPADMTKFIHYLKEQKQTGI